MSEIAKSPRDAAVEVVRTLRDAGHVAYFAGGCVRDALLGMTPKDYDVATDAPPTKVQQLFRRTQAVGAAFGVILVRVGGVPIEVATFRTDGTYTDGRRPDEVVFSDAKHDAERRDFTINGLFYDPVAGEVIDHVGGQDDLRDRRIRAIGDPERRFAEDQLRLLRAVRFATRFDCTYDQATAAAIRSNAPKLARIAPERIADELRRMLVAPARVTAWRQLVDFGLAAVLLRHVPGIDPGEPLPLLEAIGTSEASFGVILALLSFAQRAGSQASDVRPLLEPRAVASVRLALKRSFRLSNDELDAFTAAMSVNALLGPPPTDAFLLRMLARPDVGATRLMMGALLAVGLHGDLLQPVAQRLDVLASGPVGELPWVTGDDLVAAGFTPGPPFKRALDLAYDAQLERRVRTCDDAMRLATEALSHAGRQVGDPSRP